MNLLHAVAAAQSSSGSNFSLHGLVAQASTTTTSVFVLIFSEILNSTGKVSLGHAKHNENQMDPVKDIC